MRRETRRGVHHAWAVLDAAWRRFLHIDGLQRAAAFAYSAFFSLFPGILLTVSAASYFLSPGEASYLVLDFIENFVPYGAGTNRVVFQTLSRLAQARGQASAVALLMLVWTASQVFTTLIQAANRAWGTQGTNWWKLPLKSLAVLAVTAFAVLAGIGIPMAAKLAAGLLHSTVIVPAAHRLALFALPWAAVYLCLAFFYRLAPHRRTSYAEVRLAAFLATLLLYAAQSVFVFYLRHFASLNAIYGAFGGLMALMLWIYISGIIFVFCACLSAAQAGAVERAHA
ncbi:MAG: YihY/virulence factor BrkB family protein [Elusimicrobia bacterium]|nr:YihY/virulence factor BrkB family protein [Elusimicrobiota bacterium]